MRAPEGYLTVQDAADRAHASPQTIYRWLDEKRIRGVRKATRRCVEEASLESFLQPQPEGERAQ